MLNILKFFIMKNIRIIKQQETKKKLIPVTIANFKRTQWNNSRRFNY